MAEELATGADVAVIVGVAIAVLVYLCNRYRPASSDVLAAVNNLRDEVRRDLGRIDAAVKELRTGVAGIDRRLEAVETILTVRATPAAQGRLGRPDSGYSPVVTGGGEIDARDSG